MPLLRPEATQYSQSAARQTIERYEPSLYESFATGFGEGLQYTSFGMAGRMTQWYRAGIDSEPIEEDAWKESKHFREGLKYFTGMTQDHAALLAYRHDIRAHRDFVRQHQKGFLSKAAGFMGSLAGNIPDPVNYIPYVRGAASLYLIGRGIKTAEQIAVAGKIARTASRLRAATWTGSIAKSAAVSSAEAVAGTAVLQPLFIAEGRQSQIEYNYVNVLEQLGFAGVIGAGFGGLSAILKHVPAEVHEKGFVKTLDDVTAESPRTPDVAPVIKQDIEDAVTKIETRIDELKEQKIQKEAIVKQLEELKIQKLETELAEKARLENIKVPEEIPIAKQPVVKYTPLPAELSKAKPRYSYGQKAFIPEFKSDVDKALYITAQTKKSARDADYRDYLKRQGFSETEINKYGSEIRQTIKAMAAAEEGGTHAKPQKLVIKKHELKNTNVPSGEVKPGTPTTPKAEAYIDAKIAELEKTLEGITKAETAPGIPKPPSTETGIDKAASAISEENKIRNIDDIQEQIELLQTQAQKIEAANLIDEENRLAYLYEKPKTKREIALDYSKAETEKPLDIPPPPKESTVKGLDDINEQIESLKTDMQDLESRDLLTTENKKALADTDKAVKDVALWKKAIRMAKDCVMGEQD